MWCTVGVCVGKGNVSCYCWEVGNQHFWLDNYPPCSRLWQNHGLWPPSSSIVHHQSSIIDRPSSIIHHSPPSLSSWLGKQISLSLQLGMSWLTLYTIFQAISRICSLSESSSLSSRDATSMEQVHVARVGSRLLHHHGLFHNKYCIIIFGPKAICMFFLIEKKTHQQSSRSFSHNPSLPLDFSNFV